MSTELLDRATEYARGVLAELTQVDLRRPTPCTDWDAGRVVLHLADVIDALTSLVETGVLALPQPPRTDDPAPVALVDERLVKLTQAISVAADVASVETAATAGAIELTTHGWDVGISLNSAHRIPESLAEEVLAVVLATLTIGGRGDNFAAAVDLPDGALASDRLVAFLGRTPRS